MPGDGPICLLGHHETDYPRNRSVRESLEAAGFRVVLCHSRIPFPWRHLSLAWQLLRAEPAARWVFVTEGGHRLVPLVRLVARLGGRRVAFDPFISRYNTRIEDRALHSPRGLQALICKWQDWSSTRAADFLFFDTEEHRQYFRDRYGVRKPSAILPVGVDESVFRPAVPAGPAAPGVLRVLFYGTYIPLQGVEWVVEAAARPEAEGMRFSCIGRGQTFPAVKARALALGLPASLFAEPVPPETLALRIAAADVCLGIFGDTVKAANVVPNKAVQAAAMGKALVTRDSPAIRRYFRDGESALLVPPASPEALAAALRRLRDDPGLRASLGSGAREVFDRHFSRRALAAVLRAGLA